MQGWPSQTQLPAYPTILMPMALMCLKLMSNLQLPWMPVKKLPGDTYMTRTESVKDDLDSTSLYTTLYKTLKWRPYDNTHKQLSIPTFH